MLLQKRKLLDPEELSPFCCPGAGAAAPKVLSGLASWSPPVAGASSVAATPSFALRGLEPPLATAFSLPSAHSFVGRFFCAGMRCSAPPHSHSLDLLVFRTNAVPERPAGTGLGTPGRPAGACPGEAKAPLCQPATLGRPASVWRSLSWVFLLDCSREPRATSYTPTSLGGGFAKAFLGPLFHTFLENCFSEPRRPCGACQAWEGRCTAPRQLFPLACQPVNPCKHNLAANGHQSPPSDSSKAGESTSARQGN